ncbi:MAG: type VI secretion system lipoprotein TssJ [Polyangiales bacterium]
MKSLGTIAALAIVAGVLGAGSLLGAGCRSETVAIREPKKCQLSTVGMTVLASPNINPNAAGEPRPVVLRIYQLKNDVNLQNASFEQIWKDDKTTLGDDLVKVDELSVFPNSRSDIKFERDDTASYVVVVALFRNPKGKSWFASFELPPAPGKGECGGAPPVPSASGSACPDGSCGDNAPKNTRFVVWVDGTKVEAGDDHIDEMPTPGRVQTVNLGAAKGAGSAAPKGATSKGN